MNGVVVRGDGARLYGLDAEAEIKQRLKRDSRREEKILEWIVSFLKWFTIHLLF
jgi:hypothetical protein